MGDWIQWSGGECPVEPRAVVDYLCRDEEPDNYLCQPCEAELLEWQHEGECWDIIAYRVVSA